MNRELAPLEPVRWTDTGLRIIDQRQLPGTLVHWDLGTVEEVAEAIQTLAVRGAPAIGITAAYGVVVGARETAGDPRTGAERAVERLRRTRPTAYNLFHDLDRMVAVLRSVPPERDRELIDRLLDEAHRILHEDLDTGKRIGAAGLALFPQDDPVRVLTHCNAGGLATGGWGTALAPLYAAAAAGRSLLVFADETRPLLQGSRLTAWELASADIPVRVVVDGAAATVLDREAIDLVIVGADRVVANGDVANKIGTRGVALAAADAGVPFYVAAPLSTFDPSIPSGDRVPVEERGEDEVLGPGVPGAVRAFNPAFDITPARLIRGWITEWGCLQPPFTRERLEEARKGKID